MKEKSEGFLFFLEKPELNLVNNIYLIMLILFINSNNCNYNLINYCYIFKVIWREKKPTFFSFPLANFSKGKYTD